MFSSCCRQFFSPKSIFRRSFGTCPIIPESGFTERIGKYFVFDQIRPDVFVTSQLTSSAQGAPNRAYGGLIFAQALAAAEKTVPSSHYPHALHSFFIQNSQFSLEISIFPVDTSIPLEYHVRRSRDGKSFFTRCVEAIQNGKITFTLQASFHTEEPHSMQHSDSMPADVTHWSKIPPAEEMVPRMTEGIKKAGGSIPKHWKLWFENYLVSNHIFDCRIVDPMTGSRRVKPMHSYFWFRTTEDLPDDDEKLNRYLLAFISDALMSISILRPHFVNRFSQSMILSLDHSIWYHEIRPRVDDWFLMEVQTPVAGYSRAFAFQRVFAEDGRLLMSAGQDVLVRSKGKTSRL